MSPKRSGKQKISLSWSYHFLHESCGEFKLASLIMETCGTYTRSFAGWLECSAGLCQFIVARFSSY